jgi:lysophospholipase L1-like esterase
MNHSGKSLGTLGELFPDSAVTCRISGCHSLIPIPRGGTAPADRLCDSCREQLATLQDRPMPCSGSGCTATWSWPRQQQHEALLRNEPPPRRLCDACKNKRNSMQDKEMPCRIKGCSGTWLLTRDEQWRDDGTAAQARFCPTCFQKYQTLRDQAVPCRIKGCHSSWTWNRYQQLEHLAAGKALTAAPKRMCRDCAAKVASLKDAEVPCKVKNCKRTVPFPAFAQLEHLLNHGPEHPAQGRMCAECFRFLSSISDQAMPCRHRGCTHTWPHTRTAQLQDWLAGRPPPQGRLCEVCTRRIKETKERAMPCAVPGCTNTWTYNAADQVRDRCAGKPAPAGRRCHACEEFQAKHPASDVPCATCGASIAWSAYEQLLTEKGAFTKPTVCAACNEKTLAVKRQEPPVHRDEAHKNVIRLPNNGRWNQDPAIAQWPPHLTHDVITAAQTADLRIVALGDDLTWSAADPAEAWPALLQHKLNEDTSRRTCVINAGIPGTTSAQGAVRVPRDVTAFAPHLVMVSFVLGDAWVDPATDYDRHPRHRLPPDAAGQSLNELFAKLKELGCPILFWTPNPILPEDEAERLGPEQLKWATEMAASFDHTMAQARHLCAQHQIPVVDVHARFEVNGKKSTRHWMRDWCHHNPAGARNIAAWLAEAMPAPVTP